MQEMQLETTEFANFLGKGSTPGPPPSPPPSPHGLAPLVLKKTP